MIVRGRYRMMTTSAVASMLNIHINTVRRWSDQGILKPYRIGPRGDRRFMREDIIDFLSTQPYAYKNSETGKNRSLLT
jgi:excisionase family DNA binding protein